MCVITCENDSEDLKSAAILTKFTEDFGPQIVLMKMLAF
jgi:hypothetical protein